jgi:hypothetical protein
MKTAKNGCWLQAFLKNLAFLCPARHILEMIIKAIVHQAEEGGFWAEVPALPGCLTQGETREELEGIF